MSNSAYEDLFEYTQKVDKESKTSQIKEEVDPRRKELASALKAKGYKIVDSYKDPRAEGRCRYKVYISTMESKLPREDLSQDQVEEIQSIVNSVVPEAYKQGLPSWNMVFVWDYPR